MADNTVLNLGTGGDTIATDEVGGVKFQRVKIALGADGAAADAPVGGGVESGALRVTLASDSTGVVSVDDNGGALTVDGTVELGATSLAALESLTTITTVTTVGAVTAITNALPAGTNNIGDVDLASALPAGTNNIGDVDVLSVVPGTGATSLGKAEDAAHSSGDTGVMGLAVRRDADTSLVGTDGDYAPLQVNAAGSLKVAITAGAGSGGTSIADGASFTRDTTSLTPAGAVVETSAPTLTNGDAAALSMTTAGALRVSVASGGVSGIVDDAAFTPGTTEGVMFMAHADESGADAVDEGDAGALRMTLNRALHATIRCADGTTAMDETNDSVRVTIVSGAGSGGTAMTDDAAFTPGTTSITPVGAMFDDTSPDSVNEGDGGVVRMSANRNLYVTLRDAAGNERGLNVDAAGAIAVASHAVTNAGTFAVQNNAATPAGTNNIGDVDVLTVPADPFGANADAASATGSISAKLRFIAATGIPITGTVTVGSHAVTNAGTFVTQENGAALTALQLIDDTIVADDGAFTVGTTKVGVAGYLADESSTDSVDEGDAGAARMTLDRKQIVTPYAHAAAGGALPYKNLDCDETEDEIKGAAGKLFFVHAINLAATKRYLKFYNATAANVTVGTTTPVLTFPLPTMADTNGAGFTISLGPHGVQFDTAMTVAATTGFADNDTGAPGGNEVILNAGYI
jgi:hypothetical protein